MLTSSLAQAAEFDAAADSIFAEITNARASSLPDASGHRPHIPAGYEGRAAEANALRSQARQCRAQSKLTAPNSSAPHLSPQVSAMVDEILRQSAAPPAAAIAAPPPSISRDEKIRTITAGAPFEIPESMVEKAMAGAGTVEAFALEVADFCALERLARSIANCDNPSRPYYDADRYAGGPEDQEVAALAMQIANS